MEDNKNPKEVSSKLTKVLKDTLQIDEQQAQYLSKEIISKYLTELMPMMANYCPDPIFMHDLDGNIIYVNEIACQSLGYSSEEIYNLKIWDIEVDWLKEKMIQFWKDVVSKESSTIYGKHRRKDGSVFPVEIRVKGFDYGTSQGVLAIARNISYRKSLEEKLVQSEREKRTILQHIKVPIAYKDKENRFIWINEQFSKEFGVTNQDVIGKTCSEALYKGGEICKNCPVESAINNKLYSELKITTNDQRSWIISANPIIDDEDNVLGAIELIYNITELVSAEEKLKELNVKKDKLFSIIAHDLRGSIASILSLSDVIVNSFSKFSLKELKEFSKNLNDSSNNLFRLLSNLLLWSQIQLGNYRISKKEINLKELIYQSLKLNKENYMKKNLRIQIDIPPLYRIFTDAYLMENVFSNIISNAIKYSYPNQEIEISAQNIGETKIEISIIDFGVGIREDIQSKLFMIDKRMVTKGTNDEIGSGLGLILCKEILSIIGGSIKLESQMQKGTKVFIELESAK